MHDKPHTKESIIKCSLAQKARWGNGAYEERPSHSEETRNRIRDTLRKGFYKNCLECKKTFYVSPSGAGRKYCSKKCQAKAFTGKRSPLYKEDAVRRLKPRYGSPKDRAWRKKVFERDDYTCQYCLERGGRLHSHHIKSYKDFSKLRHILNNGLTLCEKCHYKLHSKRG